jgi:hypothetical protein
VDVIRFRIYRRALALAFAIAAVLPAVVIATAPVWGWLLR